MDYHVRNQRSLAELRDLVERLTDERFPLGLGGGWTVGAGLAHVAFWDRYAVALLDKWMSDGFRPISPYMFAVGQSEAGSVQAGDFMSDFVNRASLPAWASLTAAWVRAEVVSAAEEANRCVAAVPADLIDAIVAGGAIRVLDRSLHRGEHLRQLAAVLAR